MHTSGVEVEGVDGGRNRPTAAAIAMAMDGHWSYKDIPHFSEPDASDYY
jgi:hypothetical protein